MLNEKKENVLEDIKNIKQAISMLVDDMPSLAYETDLWNSIHEYMNSETIPFDVSFDEIEWDDMDDAEIEMLRAKMYSWLGETLQTALASYAKVDEILSRKTETVSIRFVKSGSLQLETPENWDEFTEDEKREWAEDQLQRENNFSEVYDSLRNDESLEVEAIESVERGYIDDVEPTKLWKAYKGA